MKHRWTPTLRYRHRVAAVSALSRHTLTYAAGYPLGHIPMACKTILLALSVFYITRNMLAVLVDQAMYGRRNAAHDGRNKGPLHLRFPHSFKQNAGLPSSITRLRAQCHPYS